MVGTIGKVIGNTSLNLFGLFAYVYPFVILSYIYFVYRYVRRVNFRFVEFSAGCLLLFFTILLIQANITSTYGGKIGNMLISSIKPSLGSVGVWVLLFVFFFLSIVLIFEERFFIVVKKWFAATTNIQAPDIKKMYKQYTDDSVDFQKAKNDNVVDYDEISTSPNPNFDDVKTTDTMETKPLKQSKKPRKLTKANVKKEEEYAEVNLFDDVEHLSEVAENKALLDELEKGKIIKPKNFTLPSLKFLNAPEKKSKNIDESEIDQKIFYLLEKLRKFKIDGDVVRTYSGPVVTTFEFRPAANIKVSKILTLQDDLAMALKARTIRIQAPIPGKDVVGIEIPNQDIETIYLREILESEIFAKASSPLTIALGKDIVGQPFVTDLKKLPHLLIAGTTGSGKSVGINAMLISLLYRNSPKTLRLIMIDPKMLEFSMYNDIPHLLTPVITEPKKAIVALANLVSEMDRRYKIMAQTRTKNIENYNDLMSQNDGDIMPYIVVIIDELADLMMTSGKDVEHYIARLAQKARASGIHLIVATQRPSVDVVTGLIKANLPSRVSFRVGSKIDSKVILDQTGAESLLGRGDMLFTPPSSPGVVRLHAPFASEAEINKIVDFLKAQEEVVYDEAFLSGGDEDENIPNADIGEVDELYEEAKQVVLESGKTSISYLQRQLRIGYNRAANIVEQMEKMGFLSKADAKGQREILN